MRDLNQQSHVNIYWRLSKWTLPHIRQNYIEDYPNFLRRTILKDPGVCHLYLCLGLKPISSDSNQLKFELRRRKLNVDGDLPVLAARLNLGILMGNPIVFIEADPTEELKYCQDEIDIVVGEAAQIKAKTRTAKVIRVQSKTLHIINRLENAKLMDGADVPGIEALLVVARDLVMQVESNIAARIEMSESEFSDLDGANGRKVKSPRNRNVVKKSGIDGDQGNRRKYVPVHKWNLKKFDGNHPEHALEFLRLVEDTARARMVTDEDLLEESADLFEHRALKWHRDAMRRVSTWEELKREFKIAFQVHAADGALREQIRNTKQSAGEGIDMFLSTMADLYDRLERPLSEVERLEEILRNLSPFLKDQLYCVEIQSIEQLRKLGRRAEAGRSGDYNELGQPDRHVQKNQERWQDIKGETKKMLDKQFERNQKQYNAKRKDLQLNIGDLVWRRNYVKSSAVDKVTRKLAPKFIGPRRVVERHGRNVYELQDLDGMADGRWHVKDLFLDRTLDGGLLESDDRGTERNDGEEQQ
ncbi:hypothetical protein GE061_003814 [Apolygus lucorum]|uniref:Retrotransposon gag domain-containing protein n=1 Tax=Apolygus lucorum TaxID=248454 RepID=A0A8S9X737_APOLU|nr:hypothetical protein GE061_003814 [Apolygus lucorum]